MFRNERIIKRKWVRTETGWVGNCSHKSAKCSFGTVSKTHKVCKVVSWGDNKELLMTADGPRWSEYRVRGRLYGL